MAEMTASEINDLPDSDFAHVESGGVKDKSGKTVPRSLRHFPIHDAAHVRNALSRAPQSPFGDAAMPKIKAAAAKFGIDTSDDGGRSLGERLGTDVERRYLGENGRSAYHVGGFHLEVRSSDDGRRHIVGYGAVFNRRSRNLGGFVEQAAPQCTQRSALEGFPGAIARYNHDQNMLLGTIAARTLEMRPDQIGLFYDVIPPQSRSDITELVERGDVRHSSFAFRCMPGGDEWSVSEENYPLRTLTDVEIVDVAPVVTPAYPDATAGLRSLAARFDAAESEVRALADADELRKFFIRTDNRGPARKPVVKTMLGAAAATALMARREDPWLDME
jgi:HK97 family phage prohead protease